MTEDRPDFRQTVFLPRTAFPMRGGLPKKEPEILARWAKMDLYRRLREDARGRPRFVLHDGPPYANGHLHVGHGLNKILKDIINRSRQMLGMDANYVPGWDCHGLPIEWKVEERYRAAGQDKDAIPVLDFRRECRAFAAGWVAVQAAEFQRVGVIGDWEKPYLTMDFAAEARIAGEIAKFAMNGGLYRGARPVLWSVPERTALADAEVEYHDRKSPALYVSFPVRSGPEALAGAAIAIWTTTPWTLPGNRAIALGADVTYVRLRVDDVAAGNGAAPPGATPGMVLVMAEELAAATLAAAGVTRHTVEARARGDELAGAVCDHPLRGAAGVYDFPVPVLTAGFVTLDQGTGAVHVGPGHGEDDWRLAVAHGLEIPDTVGEDGAFLPHVPLFAGRRVLTDRGEDGDANGAVIAALQGAGALLAKAGVRHNYPHSWRSKAPLIFRNTAQWFISMQRNDLRDRALRAVAATRFVPETGRQRLRSMLEGRPDWCISRQRCWGVPLPLFVHRQTGEILRDPAVFGRIADAFAAEGSDVWFSAGPARFLGPAYAPEDYEQVRDIVEVWFESGSTHAFVLEDRTDLAWPASLYLEGSDQHRGWFQSSLLASCGTRGRAPYEAVLTHGFVLDERGRKMSKSMGKSMALQAVADRLGADILRLWTVSADYGEDVRIGPDILKHQTDLYRRLRNTLRFLLGNLDGFTPAERVQPADMPELERWLLHRLAGLDVAIRDWIEAFDFHALAKALHRFCAVDLSAFYFDIRKDRLYCDAADTAGRRACRTVLDILFHRLTAWLAPILCFTAEEAWLCRHGDTAGSSVHRRQMPEIEPAWRDAALAAKWRHVRRVRRAMTGALEVARAAGQIGSSLEAALRVTLDKDSAAAFAGLDPAEIAIVSHAVLVVGTPPAGAFRLGEAPETGVEVMQADGSKCLRCYQVRTDVAGAGPHAGLCGRCAGVVAGQAGGAGRQDAGGAGMPA